MGETTALPAMGTVATSGTSLRWDLGPWPPRQAVKRETHPSAALPAPNETRG